MKKHLFLFLLLLISTFSSFAQKTFDEKMESLYKNTVPLITADELKLKREVVILDTRQLESLK